MSQERDVVPTESAGTTGLGARITWWEPGLRARVVFDAAFIVFGLGYLGAAFDLGAGTITEPGSGAFPVFAGALMVLTFAADLVKLIVTGGIRERGEGRVPFKVVAVLSSIAVYLVGVEFVGHALSGTAVFALLLFVLGSRSWWKIVMIALVAGFGTDYIFTALLGLDLPTGHIEFGVSEWI